MTLTEAKEYIEKAIQWALETKHKLRTHMFGIYQTDVISELIHCSIWVPTQDDCMCPISMVILYAQDFEKKELAKITPYNNPSVVAQEVLGAPIFAVDQFMRGFDAGWGGDKSDTWFQLGVELNQKYLQKHQR